jgi:hypothetical protein
MARKTEVADTEATQAAVQHATFTPESIGLWADALIPMIREVIRQKLKALKPLDEGDGTSRPKWQPCHAAKCLPKVSGIGSVGVRLMVNPMAGRCGCSKAQSRNYAEKNGVRCVGQTQQKCHPHTGQDPA